MPVSKHRKQPFRTRVEDYLRRVWMDRQMSARRLIYDRALPEKQEYPPTVKAKDRAPSWPPYNKSQENARRLQRTRDRHAREYLAGVGM
jgi:hypothetical protein